MEPHYAKRVSPSKLDPFALKFTGWLKAEVGRSRKQRRTVKQMHVNAVLDGVSMPFWTVFEGCFKHRHKCRFKSTGSRASSSGLSV